MGDKTKRKRDVKDEAKKKKKLEKSMAEAPRPKRKAGNDDSEENPTGRSCTQALIASTQKHSQELLTCKNQLLACKEKQTELEVSTVSLKKDLKSANDEILRLRSLVSARGVIEFFESRQSMPSNLRKLKRSHKFVWIFNNNEDFRSKIEHFFGYEVRDSEVAALVDEIHCNSSAAIHSFDRSRGVHISYDDYTSKQRKVLRAICESVPCNIVIE
uniref:Uncharacterized protein n=1 Tax=Ditylenchus dipsaci TaxID=166011 RepID=A0A915ENK9_9BILA